MIALPQIFQKDSMPALSPYLLPIVLLIGSNVFMTTAWYWHLRFKEVPLFSVILISWGLAFVEYCLAVPANRYGSAVYNPAQLKTMQEVITFVVFAGFLVRLSQGADHLEPGPRLRADRGRRVFRVSQVVSFVIPRKGDPDSFPALRELDSRFLAPRNDKELFRRRHAQNAAGALSVSR